jgi:hypothetical protein
MKRQTGALVQFCRSNAATLRSLTHGPAQMSKGMATSGGLAAGIALGLAGAFGGFTVFMIVLIMALIGAVLGAGAAIFMDGRSGSGGYVAAGRSPTAMPGKRRGSLRSDHSGQPSQLRTILELNIRVIAPPFPAGQIRRALWTPTLDSRSRPTRQGHEGCSEVVAIPR